MTALRDPDNRTDHGYPMRRWVFEDAAGRFDIDLGDSHVQVGDLARLAVPGRLDLDYGADRGTTPLREQVARLYGGDPDRVVITHGSQEALYLIYTVLLRPGDQVITFRPGWQQSWTVPPLLGCRGDVLDLGPELAVDVDAVAEVAGPRLRLVVVNTPCNPTGRRTSEQDLVRLLELVEGTNGYLLLDEEYSVRLQDSLAVRHDRVLSVSSISKVHGLPGLRIGWLYGPPQVVPACVERKHLTSISNSVLCEALAVDVLDRQQAYLAEYHRLTQDGLRLVRSWAAARPRQVRLVEPEGTPFGWLWLTTGEPSLSFCRRVLDTGVMLMPAEVLGGSGGIRLSFAREPDVLAEGLRRVDTVLGTEPDGPA